MKKLRVGIWINENYNPEIGGGFSYYSQLINVIYNYSFKETEVIFISTKFSQTWNKMDKSYELKTPIFNTSSLSIFYRIANKITSKLRLKANNIYYNKEKNKNNDTIKKELYQVVDMLYYPIPIPDYFIENFPYIYTLWDIGHLSMFAFPEVAMNNVFESRKFHHDNIPQKALMVFAESEQGKKEIAKYLNLNEHRIKVIPIFPSEIISDNIVSKKPILVNSDSFFIHYPAQFWSHKNHYNLLLAFKIALETFPNLKLIFCGSDKGNKKYITDVIENLELMDSVTDLGFIEMEELKWLYENSQGLVMPTFLGPTNMPLLEAASLGCPVSCSDLEGHKEQLGLYANYFNPLKPNEIAQKICQMIQENQNGIQKTYNSIFNIDNALIQIDASFSEIKSIRFCWGESDEIF